MAWTLISSLSAPTSNQFVFSGLSLGSYQRVLLYLDGLTLGTDGAYVITQLSTASTLRTSGYRYALACYSSGGSSTTASSNSAASILTLGGPSSTWGVGNAANENGSARLEVSNLGGTLYKTVQVDGTLVAPSGAGVRVLGSGLLEQTGAIDGFSISTSTGTLTAGKAALWGLTP